MGQPMVGAPVYGMNGDQLGTVKEVQGAAFKVDAPMKPDYWLSDGIIRSAANGAVTLGVDSSRIDDFKLSGPDDVDMRRTRITDLKAEMPATTETTRMATQAPRMATETPATQMHTGGEREIPLREEELRARKQPIEGEVDIRKEVVSEQKTIDVPVTREEVVVEQRPVEPRPASQPIGEGGDIRIPVRGERVEAEKETVVYGEVDVSKRQVQDTERLSGTVRREEAQVREEGDVEVHRTGGPDQLRDRPADMNRH